MPCLREFPFKVEIRCMNCVSEVPDRAYHLIRTFWCRTEPEAAARLAEWNIHRYGGSRCPMCSRPSSPSAILPSIPGRS